jgi:predicted nucleotide-binding protein with TIR-like domain
MPIRPSPLHVQRLRTARAQIAQISEQGLTAHSPDFEAWKDRTQHSLNQVFGEKSAYSNRFWSLSFWMPRMSVGRGSIKWAPIDQQAFERDLQMAERVLSDALEELDQEVTGSVGIEQPNPQQASGSRVFIVHGQDTGLREAVARFVEGFGLEAIILHEQASRGRTIIEKLEHHGDVRFAVVLLTPDDVGAPASNAKDLKPRARQNVMLELGYFVGKLGRTNVCALYKDGVELPTDLLGIVYVSLDAEGAWRLELAREMKAAGIPVDLNLSV